MPIRSGTSELHSGSNLARVSEIEENLSAMSVPPFSSRNQGAHAQVDNDCPESTRTALLHLLYDIVERQYLG
jgi:hypothetical protein